MIIALGFGPGSAVVSSSGENVSLSRTLKDCFGETPKPALETSALPEKNAASSRDPSAQIKDRHAHSQAVRHLIENDALQAVGHFAVDLDAAVDRSGMHDETIRFQ